MGFYTKIIPVPTIAANGGALAQLGIEECLITGIGILINDSGLSSNTNVLVESALPGDPLTRKTLYHKTIGVTSQPIQSLSGQFIDNTGTAVTSNVWYPVHSGEIYITVSASSGGVASTTGLTVILVIQY
jgi:hypothetical protein